MPGRGLCLASAPPHQWGRRRSTAGGSPQPAAHSCPRHPRPFGRHLRLKVGHRRPTRADRAATSAAAYSAVRNDAAGWQAATGVAAVEPATLLVAPPQDSPLPARHREARSAARTSAPLPCAVTGAERVREAPAARIVTETTVRGTTDNAGRQNTAVGPRSGLPGSSAA